VHFCLEIIMPPTQDVSAAVEQIMKRYDENGSDDDGCRNSHAFWDWYVIGGRYAAPTVTVQEHKPKGYHTRDKWEGDVIDLSKAIVAIAARPEFHSLLKIDQSALNRLAAATKGQAEIAGIEFVNRPVSVART